MGGIMYSAKGMKILVLVFSLFSRFVSRIKNLLYNFHLFKPRRAPLPVISVGSIALGGTEKTPLTMELLAWLLERGRRPALVSRGYKGCWEKQGGLVSDGAKIFASWEQAGDEPFLIARLIPRAGVFVGKNRLASCSRAKDQGFDTAVLDDGFQYRRLVRDLDIAICSPLEKTALREPRSSLKRADIILIKEEDVPGSKPAKIHRRTHKAVFTYAVLNKGFFHLWKNESLADEKLAKKRLLAFCGIARPERFFSHLERAGVRIVSSLAFSDHHSYPDSSLDKIVRKLRESGAEAAVTTEKDALKILDRHDRFGDLPVYFLRIGLRIEPGFYAKLDGFLEEVFEAKSL
jgi:tetraacyldisaccharide 4'-kinase